MLQAREQQDAVIGRRHILGVGAALLALPALSCGAADAVEKVGTRH